MTILQDQDYYPEPMITTQRRSRLPRDVAMGVAGAVGALTAVAVWFAIDDDARDPSIAPGSPIYSCQDYPYEEDCAGR